MPKIVVTAAVKDVEAWLKFKPEMIAQMSAVASDGSSYVAMDGSNRVASTWDVPDMDAFQAAQTAADRGVRIYAIGIGSPEGATLQIEGFQIHTQLNEQLLQEMAQITNGAYYNAATEEDLKKIYGSIVPQLIIKAENTEVTSVFAGAGILSLLIGGVISLLWFSRLP